MFCLTTRVLTFLRTTHGDGFHCSNVPQQLINKAVPIPVRLLHYGYLDEAKESGSIAGTTRRNGIQEAPEIRCHPTITTKPSRKHHQHIFQTVCIYEKMATAIWSLETCSPPIRDSCTLAH